MDRDGRAYVATRVGVEVFDRNGRVAAILSLPGNCRRRVSVSVVMISIRSMLRVEAKCIGGSYI